MTTKEKISTTTETENKPTYTFIKGKTADGRKFRPSDWADRLIGSIAVYAKAETKLHTQISDCICLTNREGVKGIVIDNSLENLVPKLFRFMNNFAGYNSLCVENLDSGEWNVTHQRLVVQPTRKFT